MLFPGQPKDSVNPGAEGMESHTLVTQESAAVYMVVYTRITSAQPVDEATFQIYKNGVFKELPTCEASADEPASPAVERYIGHSYRLNCDIQGNKIKIAGNLYWGKHYAFAVMAMSPSRRERNRQPQQRNLSIRLPS